MLYFRNFPRTAYYFGNNKDLGGEKLSYEVFQDISRYSDIIDQIKDNVSFYRTYNIQENDRPDQVSFKLYGSPQFHWTFYLLNDHLRSRGWPLTLNQLEDQVKQDFPHNVIRTKTPLTGVLLVGQTASGGTSGTRGEILRRNLDLGQIVVNSPNPFIQGEIVTNVTVDLEIPGSITAHGVMNEHLATHHYEDGDGNYVDIDPSQDAPAIYTEVTHFDRYVRKNNELKSIKVIKPDLINEVSSAFFQSVRS
tara:strand:+ start:96 stop:845 length:750 start_codon:yes stop_codon:yes gene_type:complete